MAKLNLFDIVALAKAGYSVNDVKELMTLSTENTDEPQPEGIPGTDNPPEEDKPQPEVIPKAEPKEEVLDYKKLYEESQLALQKAQQVNLSKPVVPQPTVTADDILNELLE